MIRLDGGECTQVDHGDRVAHAVARSGRLRRTVYDVSIVISEKHLFSLPEDLHYLNCAYMSPTPKRVAEAGASGIALKSVPSQIKSQDFFTNSDRVRELFARLVNVADPQRVAIIPAASYGIAVVARNTPLARGQNIVVAHEQFPSNVYAWREASRRQGIELRTVMPPDGMPRAAEWNARLLDAIDRDTAIVASAPVHWTDAHGSISTRLAHGPVSVVRRSSSTGRRRLVRCRSMCSAFSRTR